jgi:hypothetical protein
MHLPVQVLLLLSQKYPSVQLQVKPVVLLAGGGRSVQEPSTAFSMPSQMVALAVHTLTSAMQQQHEEVQAIEVLCTSKPALHRHREAPCPTTQLGRQVENTDVQYPHHAGMDAVCPLNGQTYMLPVGCLAICGLMLWYI